MMRFIGMNIMRGALLPAALLVLACGRNETMASKSAAAYREAQTKGTPVTGGHEHTGHDAATPALDTPEGASAATHTMDHTAHATGADPHAGHDMSAMDHAAMDHAAMDHAAMDHSAMDHSTMDHSTMDHTAHVSMPAGDHAAMEHDAPAPATDPHAHHRQPAGAAAHAGHGAIQQPAAGAPLVVLGVPTTPAEIARMRPAATLRPDDFDAPAPTAIEEAQKAAPKKEK